MKIICTEREKEHLLKIFRDMADTSKIQSLSCPFDFLYCSDIPLGNIKSDMCRRCIEKNLVWEVTDIRGDIE